MKKIEPVRVSADCLVVLHLDEREIEIGPAIPHEVPAVLRSLAEIDRLLETLHNARVRLYAADVNRGAIESLKLVRHAARELAPSNPTIADMVDRFPPNGTHRDTPRRVENLDDGPANDTPDARDLASDERAR